MRELKIVMKRGDGPKVAKTVLEQGVKEAAVYSVFMHGPNEERDLVAIQCSTPQSRRVISAVMNLPEFDLSFCSIASDGERAVLSSRPLQQTTKPMLQPSVDITADIWQHTHITPSFIARTLTSALLVALGMVKDQTIIIVAALLFKPFFHQIMGIGLGLVSRDFALSRRAAQAIALSLFITIASGYLVGLALEEPLRFNEFNSPFTSFLISLAIGVTGAVAVADDVGRHQLLAFAAAVQYGVLAVWFGLTLAIGIPNVSDFFRNVLTFGINFFTIVTSATAVLALLEVRERRERSTVERSEGRRKDAA